MKPEGIFKGKSPAARFRPLSFGSLGSLDRMDLRVLGPGDGADGDCARETSAWLRQSEQQWGSHRFGCLRCLKIRGMPLMAISMGIMISNLWMEWGTHFFRLQMRSVEHGSQPLDPLVDLQKKWSERRSLRARPGDSGILVDAVVKHRKKRMLDSWTLLKCT